jgi:hypothetical protein
MAILERNNSAYSKELIALLSPRNEFGSISESSGLPRTRFNPGYYTSRWASNADTLRILELSNRQQLLTELLNEADREQARLQ